MICVCTTEFFSTSPGTYRCRSVDLPDEILLDGPHTHEQKEKGSDQPVVVCCSDGVHRALEGVQASLPDGVRVWTWYQLADPPTASECFCCKGPFHISTGSLLGHQRTPFCGRCMKDFQEWFHGHSRVRIPVRRGQPKKGVLRFYDHAGVPPPGKADHGP